MRAFDYRHCVAFEDTNLVGNVYYANHVRWQGRCRELFLREHAPQVLEELAHGLSFATTRVACDYYQDLHAFDDVIVRMRAGGAGQGRLRLLFDYLRVSADGSEQLVARGEQEVVCLRRDAAGARPAPLPEALRVALEPFLEDAPPAAVVR